MALPNNRQLNRNELLASWEDEWSVLLESSPNDLASKRYFRTSFNLKFSQIQDWAKPGRVLAEHLSLKKAKVLEAELRTYGIISSLKQTGIDYRNSFSDKEIQAYLLTITEAVSELAITDGGLLLKGDCAILIEDSLLGKSCAVYLLKIGAEVIYQ